MLTFRIETNNSNTDKLDEIQRKLRETAADELTVGKHAIEMTDMKHASSEKKTAANDVHIDVPASAVDEETDIRASLIQGLGSGYLN